MIFFYNLITFFYLPIALIKLFYKKDFSFKEFKRIRERFGVFLACDRDTNKKLLWVHAVSVGEVNTSINLIKKLQEVFPIADILVTTTTHTGSDRLKRIFQEEVFHQYLPFDVIYFVKKFLRLWKPDCLILIETEIWPNLIFQSSKNRIPVILINGRLSTKSLFNYQKLKGLSKKTFSKINMIISQSEQDKDNFVAVGANSRNVHIDSSLKFDALNFGFLESTFTYDENLIKDKKIITCASTHPTEEEILLKSYLALNDDSVHLVLAPRHPERANEIGDFLREESITFSFLKENEVNHLNIIKDVTIINEIGHLDFLYSISDIAFIGGTLIKHGGQNFLEPIIHGLPISSGDSVYNFQEIANQLSELNILKYGNSVEEISSIWREELSKENNHLLKEKSLDYIHSKKGSLERSVEKIKQSVK